jgi:hypothetical protein
MELLLLLDQIGWWTLGKYNFTMIPGLVTAELKGRKRCSLASVS